MNWVLITDILIIAGIVLAFGGTIYYLVTHNPNYSPKELMTKPWKIFDLVDHARDQLTENLQKIKEETKEAMDAAKEMSDDVKAIVKQVQETVEEVKGDIKEITDAPVENKELPNKD